MSRSDSPALALDGALPSSLLRPPLLTVKDAAEWALGLKHLQRHYDQARTTTSCTGFFAAMLRELDVQYAVAESDLDRIPRSGATIVVANHPFGAIEGIVLGDLLTKIRPDVKIMANSILGRIPELREGMILVDPFGAPSSTAANVKPLREAAAWLRRGGLLLIFPAGEVASLSLSTRRVTDPAWSGTLARLIRLGGATVVPIFIDGRNDWLFQCAGLLHPRLRTVLLPHALLRLRKTRLQMAIGKGIPFDRLARLGHDAEIMEYLRARTFALASRRDRTAAEEAGTRLRSGRMEELGHADLPWVLRKEVEELPEEQRLLENADFAVYWARASQIPRTLREIGRLREETFRAVGEGTGTAIDLDRFDGHYLHLFLWDRAKGCVAGGYRIGKVDMIMTRFGVRGLYTNTLFHYTPALLERLGPALEIGRAFVRTEYQRSYSPLLMLWKGIGAFIAANPRYSTLFGPISISGDYRSSSRFLMQRFLEQNCLMPELASEVRPRTPFRADGLDRVGKSERELLFRDMAEVTWTISDIEEDEKGLPVLLRQYLKLGARVLDFNVDHAFSDAVDVLIVVDLLRTERGIVERYLGAEGAARFHAYQEMHAPCMREMAA